MDPLAAKFLGAGLACIGMGGAAIGVATFFGQFRRGVAPTRPRRRARHDPVISASRSRSVRHLLAADALLSCSFL